MPPFENLMNYILGTTTLASLFLAWKSKNSEIKKAEASALEIIQGVYDKFCIDTDKKFERMQNEIQLVKEENYQFKSLVTGLQKEVEQYKIKCSHCANNLSK